MWLSAFITFLKMRPQVRTEFLTLFISLVFTLLCNGVFWNALLAGRDSLTSGTWLMLLCTGLLITGLQWLLLLLVATRWSVKPLLILLAVMTPAAVYFMRNYGVYLDKAMLRNLMETDVREASELLQWRMLPYLLVAAVSVWWIARVRVLRTGWKQAVMMRSACLAGALAMISMGLWPVMDVLIPTLRENKPLRYLITPANYVISGIRVLTEQASSSADEAREVVAADAHRGPQEQGRRPRALVLVVGETVRAANWGLSGYERQTTPELAARDVINFSDVTSCGTDTATSLPCMFSLNGRRDYDERQIRRRESVLHVLNRSDVNILWRDNQSGCKGVCDGLPFENLSSAGHPTLCHGERCLDEILLEGLAEKITTSRSDMLIVLHMLGNHGPAYFQRYPASYRRWSPTCDTTDLASCSHEALVNTYDNAVLYTDHVLARTIDLLSGIRSHDTALLYVSDHGESLGEKGLYLHGIPYVIAPDEQIKVPMIWWQSSQVYADQACMQTHASRAPVSHDHLFHTLLGMFDVKTAAYTPELDLLATCRKGQPQ
ncbi:MCR-5 family phosphoethanolamine--lipid A transferase [Morganella morganii]|uniref:MCR-5 family phosphoethanolamine--lipid A transferase n=1 Tax=Morganella morganii TaxID=582 RepID=UPI00189131A1|nr:MCR-5 family phosphoethanolamine--lipid A transferase [Morganella morganii]